MHFPSSLALLCAAAGAPPAAPLFDGVPSWIHLAGCFCVFEVIVPSHHHPYPNTPYPNIPSLTPPTLTPPTLTPLP